MDVVMTSSADRHALAFSGYHDLHPERFLPSRMVKKLETALTAQFMTPPSPTLRLACCPPHPAYSTPIEGGTGGGGKAYGLEDIACVHYGLSGPRTAATERVPGDRKSHAASPDQRSCTLERWRAQDPGRNRKEAGQASAGGSGHHRQTGHHPGLAPEARGP